MFKLFLRALNAPALIFLVAIGVAIQSSLFGIYPLRYIQPDVVLIVVIWCALKRSFVEGGILTLILGNVAEIHSSSPQGLMLISYMSVYLLVKLASRWLVIPTLSSLVLLTLGASVVWKLVSLGTLYLMGAAQHQWRHTLLFIFFGALANGALAIWLYKKLDRFDWVTFKNARAQQLLEDELRLEEDFV